MYVSHCFSFSMYSSLWVYNSFAPEYMTYMHAREPLWSIFLSPIRFTLTENVVAVGDHFTDTFWKYLFITCLQQYLFVPINRLYPFLTPSSEEREKKNKLNLCLLCNNFRRVFPVCNLPLVIRIFSKYYNLTHWYFSLL